MQLTIDAVSANTLTESFNGVTYTQSMASGTIYGTWNVLGYAVDGALGGSANFTKVVPFKNSTTMGSAIVNFTQDGTKTVEILNHTFKITENYITPQYAGVTINNITYELFINSSENIANINSVPYYAKLLSISYLPIIQTVEILVYAPLSSVPTPVQESTTTANTTTVPPATTQQSTTSAATTIAASNKSSTQHNTGTAQNPLSALPYVILVVAVVAAALYLNRYFIRKRGGRIEPPKTEPIAPPDDSKEVFTDGGQAEHTRMQSGLWQDRI